MCSDHLWGYVEVLFMAASAMKDDILLNWVRDVIEARCSKQYSPEYHALMPEWDNDLQPWLFSFENSRVAERISAAVAKLEGEIHRREQAGKSKI
jgi:hypothetical protein